MAPERSACSPASLTSSSRSEVSVIKTPLLSKKPAGSGTLRAFVWVMASEFVSALRLLYLRLKVVCCR